MAGHVTFDRLLRVAPSQVLRTGLDQHGYGTAVYSEDERYRFRLSRVWDPARPRCLFVMLNPSTASESKLDPTVKRCVKAATSWGFGSAEIVNIFAYRSTDPKALRTIADAVGKGNDNAILSAAKAADKVIVAWGVHGAHLERANDVAKLLSKKKVDMYCLGVTKSGAPRHPLYLPAGVEPILWVLPS